LEFCCLRKLGILLVENMRFAYQAKTLFTKAVNGRTALAFTGVAMGVACPLTAYCRSGPTRLRLPEGETWETMLDKCFPPELEDINREETRVAFKLVGFKNKHLPDLVFTAMDLDGNGKLTRDEVLQVAKLLNSGEDRGLAEFLFNAVDADHNKKVSRKELQAVLYALLETKFLIERTGLREDVPAFFKGFSDTDFQSYAKYCSNRLCEDIFNYADSNRDGRLSFSEFFKWYRRGGREVCIVQGVIDDLISDFNDDRTQ